MKTLDEKLMMIEEVISDENFRKNKGLSNEVGYYIFDYPAEEEIKVRKYLENLKNKSKPQGYELVIYDVYDIMLDLIEEEGLMENCIEMEVNEGLDYLISAVNDILRIDYDDNYFNTYIEENTPNNSVVFITGIGKIFPFARAHGILNKLHLVFDRAPVVLFYPGKYDGQSLMLFSEFKDDNYYRAFPLIR
ncbi:DUF1788 domain-containing protein [Clostridium sp. Cult1]|uniref:DUF1788 domain-containing protein n=1 Tax=Clostridium sp. Cult1 TaxID=2079002 RepID=UPI001F451B37|nr:DUF1788 domain-containing protein [Clostridium sp. Cult1]